MTDQRLVLSNKLNNCYRQECLYFGFENGILGEGVCEVKCFYLYWITLSAISVVLSRGPVSATPHGSSVIADGNRITRRKPAMLATVKLDNSLLTCDQGNFNQITARSRKRTLVTVVGDTCTTTAISTPKVTAALALPNKMECT